VQTLQYRNHQRAFVMSALLMFTGFTVIPYITIFMQANVGLTPTQIPLIYLVGGVATLFSARWIGRTSDRWGTYKTFSLLAVSCTVPMLVLTLLPAVPLVVALCVTTLFFVFVSGRMIPGMAILTSVGNPALRGTFMTLNASVQSAAMGLAALVGGYVISRDSQGLVQNYWLAACLGAIASIGSVIVAKSVVQNGEKSSIKPRS
jgi:predicted MFS family arabinose efflux permease